MSLPPRTSFTTGDAIALSSPSGRMSQRARRAAEKRLHAALFGEHCTREDLTGEGPEVLPGVALRRSAANLRDLAARGMYPRKYPREAAKLEQQADALDAAWRNSHAPSNNG